MKVYVYVVILHDDNFFGVVGVYATLNQAMLVRRKLGDSYSILTAPVAGFPALWVSFGLGIALAAIVTAIMRVL